MSTPSPAPLTPAVAREVFAELCRMLPPPSADTPAARQARDALAMDAVVALQPADAFEVTLAVRVVAADAHAGDSLRLAALAQTSGDAAERHRCLAQAASMSRQSNGAYRALERRQTRRDKQIAEMHPAAMERAGWWFREAEPEPPPPPAAAPQAEETAPFKTLTEAERYAVIYPERARRIRAAGGLPAPLDFGPPEPALVQAIVQGTSPILRALDPPHADAAE